MGIISDSQSCRSQLKSIVFKPLPFKKFQLAQKLTILLCVTFAIGTVLSGIFVTLMVNQTAEHEISSKALMLMETMNSVRTYSNSRITPKLADRMATEFLPESVSAFAAQSVFEQLRKNSQYQEFLYRETALNPSNLQDRADTFETGLIERFRANPELKEQTGFRRNTDNAKGEVFYIARPLRVSNSSCLQCHGDPKLAPPSMIAKYGDKHGFNWKLNEIIGAQTIVVPAQHILNNAQQLFVSIMGLFLMLFGVAIAIVNVWLRRQVVKPVIKIARIVEEISMGDLDARLDSARQDEIGVLSHAIDRLSLSLKMAMRRIQIPCK
jgi:methyl-accepting chemotaxis protein